MTKKKAIEAAIDKAERDLGMSVYRGGLRAANIIGGACYEAGLIAGRKQAIAQLPDAGLIRAWDTKRKLRQWANAQAKKARAK